jgi:aminoglycoside phosphotransferase (APT) family kinase protein
VPPDVERPTVVHCDFKLDRVMLDEADVGRLVAVLDWEMCAHREPLVDLGNPLAYWPPLAPGARPLRTEPPGWLTRNESVARHVARSGRDVSGVRYYETFALLKVAVVLQQNFYRYARAQTDDARFASFGERVAALAREAGLRAPEQA